MPALFKSRGSRVPKDPTPPRKAVWRLATARVISLSGGSAAFTALIYTIFSKTGSSLWVAVALLLTFGTAGFVSPIAGAIGGFRSSDSEAVREWLGWRLTSAWIRRWRGIRIDDLRCVFLNQTVILLRKAVSAA